MTVAECVRAAYVQQEQVEWADFAAGVATAIMEKALSLPTDELRAFIADTPSGKPAVLATESTLASGTAMLKSTLLSGVSNAVTTAFNGEAQGGVQFVAAGADMSQIREAYGDADAAALLANSNLLIVKPE